MLYASGMSDGKTPLPLTLLSCLPGPWLKKDAQVRCLPDKALGIRLLYLYTSNKRQVTLSWGQLPKEGLRELAVAVHTARNQQSLSSTRLGHVQPIVPKVFWKPVDIRIASEPTWQGAWRAGFGATELRCTAYG
jgi:hypothetical protein